MKNISINFSVILLMFCASFQINAQINRTLDTKVADILAQLPVDNLEHSDKLMQEILDLKSEGVQKFCDLIVPLGTGNDTKARYAIESVAIYSGGLSPTIKNGTIENTLLKAIENASNNEVKTFFIDRLTHCGTNVSVAILSNYLSDDSMFNPALLALTQIGTEEASAAIFNAAKTADDSKKASLIVALGNLRYAASVNSIHEWAKSDSKIVKEKSLTAIAEIAMVD